MREEQAIQNANDRIDLANEKLERYDTKMNEYLEQVVNKAFGEKYGKSKT